ncbi:MAG: hypothetical protein FJ088_10850, partial [Deltaproteobacteria bacterium]|nr:hypothetical protein [Deltaproteobacteria bacterium]
MEFVKIFLPPLLVFSLISCGSSDKKENDASPEIADVIDAADYIEGLDEIAGFEELTAEEPYGDP